MTAATLTGVTVVAATTNQDGVWTSLFETAFSTFTQEGGWPAFGILTLIILIGSFAEWWVPGRRHRRVEAAAAEQSKVLADTVTLLSQQSMANEITKDFFLKTVPKRGEAEQ
jgi:hypothetical protein